MDLDTIRRLLKVQLYNHETFKHYTAGSRFGGEVLYFYATHLALHQGGDDLMVAEAELRMCLQNATRIIWQQYLNPAATHFVPIDSDHDAMLQEPHVADIASTIHRTSEVMAKK
jgi:hypothetical protein